MDNTKGFCYNADNRKQIVDQYTVVTSIDRVKFSYRFKHKKKRRRRSILNQDFKSLENVEKYNKKEVGYYYQYIKKQSKGNNIVVLVFKTAFSRNATAAEKQQKIKRIGPEKTPQEIELEKKGFQFRGPVEYQHYDYRIKYDNDNSRAIRNKDLFTLEINDVIQENLKQTIFRFLRNVLLYLFRTDVFLIFSKRKTENGILQKTYRTIGQFKISEVEIAFDITYRYGRYFWNNLVKEATNNPHFQRNQNTIYWNNSQSSASSKKSRWRWKFYNKSLKDREDARTPPYSAKPGDVYRLEITIGRDWIREKIPELGERSTLKKKHFEIIRLFESCCSIGLTHFFERFGFGKLKGFIEDIKATTPFPLSLPNTTTRNWKQILKILLFQTRQVDLLLNTGNSRKTISEPIGLTSTNRKKDNSVGL